MEERISKEPYRSSIWSTLNRSVKSGLRFMAKNPRFTVGLIVMLIMLFIAIFAEQLVPHDPYKGTPKNKLLPPFWMEGSDPRFPLGTDYIGRDLLSRLFMAIRTSLIISICAVTGAVVLGILVGIAAGMNYPGPLDSVLMRITDIQMGIPFIVMVIIIVSLFTPTIGSCTVVLMLATWATYGRCVRSSVMLQKEMDYIAAAKIMGARPWRIAGKYLGRNILPGIFPVVPMDISGVILTESCISFMSLGIQPPTISLGNIMADGRNYISTHWWITGMAGIVILIMSVSLTLIGDDLQKNLDDHSRQ
ncbi:MAG: ABC transporter permease [Eubacteriales bacterium]|nr:ABC transporter permease [Eubacteriales bacterium]